MIFTVTLNPSLDKTLQVQKLQPGRIHRARLVRSDLGGKGINVSRALQALGINSRIVGFAGGGTGQVLQSGLREVGFDPHLVKVAGETRQNITLFDQDESRYTKINELGPLVCAEDVAALHKVVADLAAPGDGWAFCGSLPPGAPEMLYADLIRLVQGRGARALLDASGPALREGIAVPPFALKLNDEEAGELLGVSLTCQEEVCRAARRLQAGGSQLVVLTRGEKGLILAWQDEIVVALPPAVAARSPVGAGDATLAGIFWSLVDRVGPVEMARRAAACGAAAAMQEGTGVGTRALVETLLEQGQVVDSTRRFV